MTLTEQLMQTLAADESEMLAIRRHLHAHPEISFHEKQTAAYIKQYYAALNVPVTPCGEGYGMYVDIQGGQPGPTLALRADFDALAIQEDNDLSFKSQNPGVMHACGHDAHTAYLLVLAKELIKIKAKLAGTIRIIHQPAEEVSPGGAKGMVAAGVLEGVDNVLGVHVIDADRVDWLPYRRNPNRAG